MTDEQPPSPPQDDGPHDAGSQGRADGSAASPHAEARASPGAGAPPLAPDLQAANASKDERTWAMAAHLAALAGFMIPFGNILGPLVVWLVKREESAFVAYHAKQSMWFQIITAIALTVLVILAFCTFGLTALLAMGAWLGAVAYAIYGAVQVSGGKDFEYYWVGPWVRRSA